MSSLKQYQRTMTKGTVIRLACELTEQLIRAKLLRETKQIEAITLLQTFFEECAVSMAVSADADKCVVATVSWDGPSKATDEKQLDIADIVDFDKAASVLAGVEGRQSYCLTKESAQLPFEELQLQKNLHGIVADEQAAYEMQKRKCKESNK